MTVKKIALAIAVSLVAFCAAAVSGTVAAQTPPGLKGPGWEKARGINGPRVSITVGNPSNIVAGGDIIASLHEWNAAAGWKLLDAYPVNDAYGLQHADIRFGPWPGPIPGPDGTRRVAWAQRHHDAQGRIIACSIWIDFEMLNQQPINKHPDVWSHEIGHCLGFSQGTDANLGCNPALYRGVMSGCNFWAGMNFWHQVHDPDWWYAVDWQMLHYAGYRP